MKQNRNVCYLNQNKTKLNYAIKFSLIKCSLFITVPNSTVTLVTRSVPLDFGGTSPF